MKMFKIFIIIIIFIVCLIFISISSIKEHLTTDEKLKLRYCEGCLDENLKCHPGCVPVCSNINTTSCYAFYDENGNLRTPCSLYDYSDDVEESCKNCQNYCIYCVDKNNRGSCVSRSIFDCNLCPNSRICRENPFDIYINKNKYA